MSPKLETILLRLQLGELINLFAAHEVDDSQLAHLTDTDLQNIGIEKLGPRKRLLDAFSESSTSAPAAVVSAEPSLASVVHPFINSLGLSFVPITGSATLFCTWQLRVQDYRIYCEETGTKYPACDFIQAPDHPMVNVSWNDAKSFSYWLTKRERSSGLIKDSHAYRLPTDREWSVAVGIGYEVGASARERSGRAKGYPWGNVFPPPRGAGNYHPSLGSDDFRETAPVGSFHANRFGIYDLGGNVWEWCMDEYDRDSGWKVLRGASCFNDDDEYLLSSYRDKKVPDFLRNNQGIRLVLGVIRGDGSWF